MDMLIGGEPGGRKTALKLPAPKWVGSFVTYFLIIITSLWTFGYVSGFFPYLGYEQHTERTYTGFDVQTRTLPKFGTKTFFLVKGQTAFFDYKVDTTDEGSIVLDVAPYYHIGLTDNAEFIKGPAEGRIEFQVEATGIYSFYHDFSINGLNNKTSYDVSWGAY